MAGTNAFGHRPAASEIDREHAVRAATRCPVPECASPRGTRCVYPWKSTSLDFMSHTARYDIAARMGVVPALSPSPGRGQPVPADENHRYQIIPHSTWTLILVGGIEATEVWQDTGSHQAMRVRDTHLEWPTRAAWPLESRARLRPAGGMYPAGWVAPIHGTWWYAGSTHEDQTERIA